MAILPGRCGGGQERSHAFGNRAAVVRALAAYADAAAWKKMIATAMKQDFSWARSAREYLRLFEGLLRS